MLKNGQLASCSVDQTIRLWDVDKLEQVQVIEGHGDYVTTIKELPNNILASGSFDETVKLWDLNSNTVTQTIDIGDYVYAMVLIDENVLAVGYYGIIRIFDLTTKEVSYELEGHRGYVRDLTLSDDKKVLYSASKDMTIKAWNLSTKE